MKILLDHCLPHRLKKSFPSHDLAAAAVEFNVFLTIDKNLKHEQNIATLPIAVLVTLAPSNRLADVIPFVPAVENALISLNSRSLFEVTIQ